MGYMYRQIVQIQIRHVWSGIWLFAYRIFYKKLENIPPNTPKIRNKLGIPFDLYGLQIIKSR